MNLAVLHYHLNPGGVTRVIANHLLALDRTVPDGQRLRVLLLFDGQRQGWPEGLADQLSSIELNFREIPEIGYQQQPGKTSPSVLKDIERALSAHRFTPQETVLHAHNHCLGKNAGFPAALRKLAADGFALLLQPHDFAEDFRPSNYRHLRESLEVDEFSDTLYFQGPCVHYATLNRRDFDVLHQSGMRRDRLHFLPNPVPGVPQMPSRSQSRDELQSALRIDHDSEYVLYPVRGIRRKNVGEFALLSVLRNRLSTALDKPCSSVFGMTLDPLNPDAISYSSRWKALADDLQLPCRFGVGQEGGLSFPDNMAAADRIVTTSVAEGFGMAFLESWIAGRGLVGRNLPEITSDFAEAGLKLDALYDRLNVPIEWIGRDVIVRAIFDACRQVYSDYGLAMPTLREVTDLVDRNTANDRIDFGSLDENCQASVIRRIVNDVPSCEIVLEANPALGRWDELGESTIAGNQTVVQSQYSLSACGERLRAIYHTLLEGTEPSLDEPADGDAILSSFLDLERFRLIRT